MADLASFWAGIVVMLANGLKGMKLIYRIGLSTDVLFNSCSLLIFQRCTHIGTAGW